MKNFLTKITGAIILSVLAITSSLGLSASPALAEYTVIPAPPNDRQFNLQIEPGSKQSETILIKNLGNSPITLELYGVDATQSSQGTFALTTRNTEQRHVGSWIGFEEESVTVEPGEELSVPFLISVPASATPGSYAGGIAIEDLGKNGTTPSGQVSSVNVSSRFIVKIFISIPGEKIHRYEWKDFKYDYANENSHARFTFEISNTGNTILLVEPQIEMDGFPALNQPVIELPTATIQPGTGSQMIDLRLTEKPPFGYYVATGTLNFSELDIVKNEKINPVTESRQITINLTPWYIIAIIAVVLLALTVTPVIWYFHLRSFRKKCTRYTVKQGDTIISVAESSGLDWKRLAKINRLKPPYTLTLNAVLLIPPKKK